MVERQQELGSDGPYFLGIAATALAVPLVGLVAGLRAPGRRLPLWVTGAMLFVLAGAGAAADPAASASPSAGWRFAGLTGAVAFVALGEWEAQRGPRASRRAVVVDDDAPASVPG